MHCENKALPDSAGLNYTVQATIIEIHSRAYVHGVYLGSYIYYLSSFCVITILLTEYTSEDYSA